MINSMKLPEPSVEQIAAVLFVVALLLLFAIAHLHG